MVALANPHIAVCWFQIQDGVWNERRAISW